MKTSILISAAIVLVMLSPGCALFQPSAPGQSAVITGGDVTAITVFHHLESTKAPERRSEAMKIIAVAKRIKEAVNSGVTFADLGALIDPLIEKLPDASDRETARFVSMLIQVKIERAYGPAIPPEKFAEAKALIDDLCDGAILGASAFV